METIFTICKLQITLLILISAGILGWKTGIVSQGFRNGLSAVLLKLILPCSVFSSFLNVDPENILSQSALIVLVTVVIHLFYILLGKVLYRHACSERRTILKFGIICPNTNFMGIPIIGGIYGDIGVLLLSVALIPARTFVNTVGVSYFLSGDMKERLKALLKNPLMWAVALGIPPMLLHWTLPSPVANALSYLGACNTPLAMILIGTVVASLTPDMLKDKLIWSFCALRLVLIPLAVLLGLRLLNVDGMAACIATMMSALPAGAMTVIFSDSYGGDNKFATGCVIVSVIASLATIPLIHVLCTAVFTV